MKKAMLQLSIKKSRMDRNNKTLPQLHMRQSTSQRLKSLAAHLVSFLEILLIPISFLSLCWLYAMRRIGNARLPLHRWGYRKVGIYPIRDHYYEPLFNTQHLKKSLRQNRMLPGINWNDAEQLAILGSFRHQADMLKIPKNPTSKLEYYFYNDTFGPGDGEYLYQMIRYAKPKRIVEIGSGNSTLMALNAIRDEKQSNPSFQCEMVCIEPFERPWLRELNITLVRELVENVDRKIFSSLSKGDILFIDSSHIVRSQGDVLCEFLELLPTLPSGVFVHVHDIFSPKDYPDQWIKNEMKLWNEQYLLEAFLSHNKDFRVIGALNWLKHQHPDQLAKACPVIGEHIQQFEPASFWFVRN